jgi:hypothetical protein
MRILSKSAGVVVLTAFLFLGMGMAGNTQQGDNGPKGKQGKAENHPAIRAAIEALDKAKRELKAANHDFHGHRVAALAAVDSASQQLEICLKVDKK